MENPYAPPKSKPAKQNKTPQQQLFFPAAALCSLSVLHILFNLWLILDSLQSISRFPFVLIDPIVLLLTSMHIGLLGLIVVGSYRMCFNCHYANARTAAELACLPIVSPFFILGIPFAVWARTVLERPDVQAHFENAEAAESDDE